VFIKGPVAGKGNLLLKSVPGQALRGCGDKTGTAVESAIRIFGAAYEKRLRTTNDEARIETVDKRKERCIS
jgi:hypothetical protein